MTRPIMTSTEHLFKTEACTAGQDNGTQLELSDLPNELLDKILGGLAAREVRSAGRVCRRWQRLTYRSHSWSLLPSPLLHNIFSQLEWRDLYSATRACSTWREAVQRSGLLRRPASPHPAWDLADIQQQFSDFPLLEISDNPLMTLLTNFICFWL